MSTLSRKHAKYDPLKGQRVGRVQHLMNRLQDEGGFTREQAAGIAGNLWQESAGFADDVLNFSRRGDDGTAHGLAQWRNERKVGLFSLAKKTGKSASNFDTQIDFMLHEFNTTEKRAARNIKQAQNAEQAALYATDYLRPQGHQNGRQFSHGIDDRVGYANRALAGSEPRQNRAIPVPAAGREDYGPVDTFAQTQDRLAPQVPNRGLFAPLKYTNQNAIRNKPVTPGLERDISQAVGAVYGKGYRAEIFSGAQYHGQGTGTRRHNHERKKKGGNAADVYIYDPNNNRVKDDRLAPMINYWLAHKKGSVGAQMSGGGIHLDNITQDKLRKGEGLFWQYGAGRNSFANAAKAGLRGQEIRTDRASSPAQEANDAYPGVSNRPGTGVAPADESLPAAYNSQGSPANRQYDERLSLMAELNALVSSASSAHMNEMMSLLNDTPYRETNLTPLGRNKQTFGEFQVG